MMDGHEEGGLTESRERLRFLHDGMAMDATHQMDKRFEDYGSLQFMESGELDIWYDASVFEMNGAWLWFHYPGPRIRFNTRQDKRWWHRYVAFSGPLFDRWTREKLILPNPISCRPDLVQWFASNFDELRELIRRAHPDARRAAVNTLENMLLKAAEMSRIEASGNALLDKTKEVLLLNDYATPNYDALARELGISAPTLRRRFRSENGIPIHSFVQRERIEKARTLVLETSMSMKEIADFLGYSDIHYFTKHFARWVGMTPARFRKSRL